jgi:hypothetical protein
MSVRQTSSLARPEAKPPNCAFQLSWSRRLVSIGLVAGLDDIELHPAVSMQK